MQLRKGSLVFPAYDGKWGRKCAGKIIKYNSKQITVLFTPYAGEESKRKDKRIIARFKRVKQTGKYEAYVGGSNTLMGAMFGMQGNYYALYRQWSDIKWYYNNGLESYIPKELLEEHK